MSPPILSLASCRLAVVPPDYRVTDRRALEMPPCRSRPHTLPFRSSRPECLPAAPPRSPPSIQTWRYRACRVGGSAGVPSTNLCWGLLEIDMLSNPAFLTLKLLITNEDLHGSHGLRRSLSNWDGLLHGWAGQGNTECRGPFLLDAYPGPSNRKKSKGNLLKASMV